MQTSRLLLSAALVASLVGAGCSSPETSSPQADAPSGAVQERASGSSTASASSCDHPYYPLKAGYRVAYKSTSTGRDTEYVFEVKESSGNTVKAQYTFPTLGALDIDMECENGNIRAKSYLDLGSISAGTRIQSTTKRVTGDLLPANVRVGTEWENEFDVDAKIDNPDMERLGMGTMAMTIKAEHAVVGEEQVTVPAGTYTALKVQSTSTVDIAMAGREPIQTITPSVEYWVKGVGMVKTSASSGTSEWSVEAQRIQIP